RCQKRSDVTISYCASWSSGIGIFIRCRTRSWTFFQGFKGHLYVDSRRIDWDVVDTTANNDTFYRWCYINCDYILPSINNYQFRSEEHTSELQSRFDLV